MGSHTKRARARDRSAARRRAMAATATVAVTLPVLGFLAQPAGAAEDSVDCAKGRVFVVPGTADPNSIHTAGLETRYGTEGKDYRIEIIDYPGVLWPLGGTSYDQSVELGIENLETAVAVYHEACPDQPVVIVGYSQGARIAGDVLSEIGRGESPVSIDPTQVTGELYSDPRRTGDAEGRGVELILPAVIPGITMNGAREGFGAAKVTQFCVEGDPICDLQDPLHYPLRAVDGLLGYFVKHLTYDDDISKGPDASENSPRDVLIPSDPAIGVILESLGLPFRYIAVDNPLQFPDLAVLRPLFHAVNQFLPPLPYLGHGAYLPDLWVLRDALSGSPAAWQAIGDSTISILRYPENFVRDWIAEIDRQLDQLDGARLGIVPAPTVANATQRTTDSAASESVWIEPHDLTPTTRPEAEPAETTPAPTEPAPSVEARDAEPANTPSPSPDPASVERSGGGAEQDVDPVAEDEPFGDVDAATEDPAAA
ncbi:PE-PPE domain-containing protein [Nocardia sp. 348MFTsu5.1]|uniref:cutinase family protein n=1 Tax=Nocardia sp. 348MFTsu5.1 TaxID=1172185 RepID=UPI0009DC45E4|nr:PE-PPE domain-containing protein [Nocardia sp. 348MFTsu5.1]